MMASITPSMAPESVICLQALGFDDVIRRCCLRTTWPRTHPWRSCRKSLHRRCAPTTPRSAVGDTRDCRDVDMPSRFSALESSPMTQFAASLAFVSRPTRRPRPRNKHPIPGWRTTLRHRRPTIPTHSGETCRLLVGQFRQGVARTVVTNASIDVRPAARSGIRESSDNRSPLPWTAWSASHLCPNRTGAFPAPLFHRSSITFDLTRDFEIDRLFDEAKGI